MGILWVDSRTSECYFFIMITIMSCLIVEGEDDLHIFSLYHHTPCDDTSVFSYKVIVAVMTVAHA